MIADKTSWVLIFCAWLSIHSVAASEQAENSSGASGRKVAMLIKISEQASTDGSVAKAISMPYSGEIKKRTALGTGFRLPEDMTAILADCSVIAERMAKSYFHQTVVLINWIVELVSPDRTLPAITPFSSWLALDHKSAPISEAEKARVRALKLP